ncbi:putative phage tail minor protein [Pseudooceanicola batsensis HTCC2597]|uniref:Putative phage tail minor protein n=1 Tax=Pseudooceanicola batsensis (strain ATCC BAA-863 / DSM 15984 / KCTC 12145 / HTCC2597) TaxID=252305 RepID=A3U3P1_PSEBH|nr:phage tail tape measure protein [Pseudooceanicola batsensis]EAQ01243.1 putative phage tail minor protein [Pseudooceanicola batsensis HTCC2597]
MIEEFEGLGDLQSQVEALEVSLGGAAGMAAGFDSELRRMRAALAETGKDVQTLERGLSRGLRRALDSVVMDGAKLSDALGTVANSVISSAYSAAVRPVTDHFGGLIARGVGGLFQTMMPFAQGGAFSQGRVMPFADGGVVRGPVTFPMRGGTGLMGEAGPEAIMPLSRGPDGRLGVKAQGGRPVTVVMNIQTPDAESFRRSQAQVASQMSRALARGQRNR